MESNLPDYGDDVHAITATGAWTEPHECMCHAGSFRQLLLRSELLEEVEELLSFPTHVQQHVIPAALLGDDVLCLAPSMQGKTIAFVISCIELLDHQRQKFSSAENRHWTVDGTEEEKDDFSFAGPEVLWLCPSSQAGHRARSEFERLGNSLDNGLGLSVALACGESSVASDRDVLCQLLPQILICTPGRGLFLTRTMGDSFLRSVARVVISGCDELLCHSDTAREIREILAKVPSNRQMLLSGVAVDHNTLELCEALLQPGHSICAFPATADMPPVPTIPTAEASEAEHMPAQHPAAVAAAARGCVHYGSRLAEFEKNRRLDEILDMVDFQQALVFVGSPLRAAEVQWHLQQGGVSSAVISEDVSEHDRNARLGQFMAFQKRILVITDAVLSIMDCFTPRVDLVIGYDSPQTCETYLRRAGMPKGSSNGSNLMSISFLSNEQDEAWLRRSWPDLGIFLEELPGLSSSAACQAFAREQSNGAQVCCGAAEN